MDKETLSNYGWIVICVLVIAVMIALATPFGNFIADGFKATFLGFGQTNNSMLDTMFDATGTPPSLEYLQNKYQFEYYSTLNGAVNDVNNGTIGTNTDANKEDAVAGIYTDAGQTYVVLLKDTTEATRVQPSVDMTINLGGHILSTNDSYCLNIVSGTTIIDGRLNGSSIRNENLDLTSAYAVGNRSKVVLLGGTYISVSNNYASCVVNQGEVEAEGCSFISTTNGTQSAAIYDYSGKASVAFCDIVSISTSNGIAVGASVIENASLTISNCNIKAHSNADSRAVSVNSGGFATITKCDIKAYSESGSGNGIYTAGTTEVSNCDIKAYSNYTYGDDGNYYGTISRGIYNSSTLTINDCYVMGTHSGVSNHGTLYVNGGTYEGYGHGGFYFSGTGATSYVRNAIIRECPMPDGYTGTAGDNNAGFYIGGATGNDNITVYMDNCDIYGSVQPIVLRGSSGEQNNSLYISNSKINTDRNIRIDNDTHKLYIGTDNNFTADDTNRPSAVIETNETYTQN